MNPLRRLLTGSLCSYLPLLLLILGQSANASTLYVSPSGNDLWTGQVAKPNAARTNGPLASLQGARDAIRKLKKKGPLTEPVQVVVAQGTYQIAAPLVLEPQDSGTPKNPISYEAAPGATPIISGGRRITGWKRGTDGIWTAQIPNVKAGKWYFEQLWINGKRATRARTPNKFYFYATGQARPGDEAGQGDPTTLTRRGFRVQASDVAPLLSKTAEQLKDVTVVAYHAWETARQRISSINPSTSALTMTGTSPWPYFNWGPQRYQLENYKEALDEAREWFLERSGTLYYKPRAGEDLTKATVVAPVVEQFLQLKGNPEAGQWVEHMNFKGLSFRYGQYVLPTEGHADGQAEFGIPAAITADGTRNVSFDKCSLSHIGIYGMHLRHGCRDIKITRCNLNDLGAGGIRIGEGHIDFNPAGQTSRITVDNNIIQGAGRIHHGAIGVWIGQSADNRVTHNDIGDLLYTGISIGWTWGYGESAAKRNTIDFNHVHHIGQGVLSDMGAVYTLGTSEGTTVSHNRIHDIYAFGYGGWGLYNDEGSTGIILENNLVYDTKSAGYHQHYGRENVLRNNIFAFGKDAQLQRTRVEDHRSFTFERNIVFWNRGPAYSGNWKDQVTSQNNLYWVTGETSGAFSGMTFAQWQQSGQEKGSLMVNPGFVNAEKRDFRVSLDSPALNVGFVPFDASKAGVYGEASWINLAAKAPMPKLEVAPPPPDMLPLVLNDDFEVTMFDTGPTEASISAPGRGSSIGVSGDTAVSGKRSLKVVDAPGLPNTFDPYFFYRPRHRVGTARLAFDLRVEENVNMYQEWRDEGNPYRVGPSFSIANGRLYANDRELMPVPTGQWMHFEVVTTLGGKSTGTWDLVVIPAGGEAKRFAGLRNGNPEWKTLDWLGFVSNATTASTFYLDNIELANQK